jgi:hypothetical protein
MKAAKQMFKYIGLFTVLAVAAYGQCTFVFNPLSGKLECGGGAQGPAGPPVADGNKGDVTVSGGVWNVNQLPSSRITNLDIALAAMAGMIEGKEPANANIQSHIGNTTNPHTVTAVQVGLGSTSDPTFRNLNLSSLTINAASAGYFAQLRIHATHGADDCALGIARAVDNENLGCFVGSGTLKIPSLANAKILLADAFGKFGAGTASGDQTQFATVSGAKTPGKQITYDAAGNLIVSAYDVGAAGGGTWGSITGTLSSQTDLQNALNLKAPLASPNFTGTVAGITKGMVGLGNVDNTADSSKAFAASQITSGTFAASLLPLPTLSTIGGIRAFACTGTDKISEIGTDGIPVCTADQEGAPGSGITSLNALSASSQTFAKVDDTNVTLNIGSLTSTHTFTLGWAGILAAARGGTGNGFTAFTGPTSATKTFTLPNASATIFTSNDAHGHTSASTGGVLSHLALTNVGTNTHTQIDTHIASAVLGPASATASAPACFDGVTGKLLKQCGDGSTPSALILPETTAGGATYAFAMFGLADQSADGCIIVNGTPGQDKVLKGSATTANYTDQDGKTWTGCRVMAWSDDATASGGTGDFSSNTSTSVDGEVVLMSGTGGKTGKRSTLTAAVVKSASGVLAAADAGTDYVAPGGALGTPSSGSAANLTSTTQSAGDNSTKIATTAYVDTGLGLKQPLDSDLTAIAALACVNDGEILKKAGGVWTCATDATSGGGGAGASVRVAFVGATTLTMGTAVHGLGANALWQGCVDTVADEPIALTALPGQETAEFVPAWSGAKTGYCEAFTPGGAVAAVYGPAWNSSNYGATQNDVYDKIETLAPLVSPVFTTPNLGTPSAVNLGNATNLADAALAAKYKTRVCEVHIWGTGTAGVLENTDDEIVSCYNGYGATETITAVRCWSNAGSPTVTPVITDGGGAILSGALTCDQNTTAPVGAAGSLSGTPTLASGGTINANITTAGGVATNLRMFITLTR